STSRPGTASRPRRGAVQRPSIRSSTVPAPAGTASNRSQVNRGVVAGSLTRMAPPARARVYGPRARAWRGVGSGAGGRGQEVAQRVERLGAHLVDRQVGVEHAEADGVGGRQRVVRPADLVEERVVLALEPVG